MPGAVVGGIAKAVIGKGVSKLLGGGSGGRAASAIENRTPTGFQSTGLSAKFDGSNFNLQRSSGVNDQLGLAGKLGFGAARDFASLRAKVDPANGEFRRARLASIRNAKSKAIGGLKEELRRRRLSGSTFESREVLNAEKEFALLEDEIQASSMLQSIEQSSNLIAAEFESAFTSVKTVLDQFNFESGVAANLANSANGLQGAQAAATSNLAQVTSNIDAENAAGWGNILGPVIGQIGDKIGGVVDRVAGVKPQSNSSGVPT